MRGGRSGYRVGGSRLMTLQGQPAATGDDTGRLVAESSRFRCGDGLSGSSRTGAGKGSEICGVDGRTATGLDAGSRMRQEGVSEVMKIAE